MTLTATDLVSITLETGEIITGTPPHPVWSVEQDDWIELGEIEEGDHVQTEQGPLEVIATEYRTTAETVYNVEVHGHHVFHIGDDGVLVHNSAFEKYKKVRSFGKKSQKAWDKGTFHKKSHTIQHHYNLQVVKRGLKMTVKQYTDEAVAFYRKYRKSSKAIVKEVPLKSGPGTAIRITVGNQMGVFTHSGKILTYHP